MKNFDCPVFYPTKQEFSDFEAYMEKIERESQGYGMAKVIPPPDWKARRKGYKNIASTVTHPVKQIVSGLAGIYQVILISEAQLSYKSYKEYSKKRDISKKISIEEIERLVINI
jgi:[histone H3]-trimethyl-L-lysine9/36 demethylase